LLIDYDVEYVFAHKPLYLSIYHNALTRAELLKRYIDLYHPDILFLSQTLISIFKLGAYPDTHLIVPKIFYKEVILKKEPHINLPILLGTFRDNKIIIHESQPYLTPLMLACALKDNKKINMLFNAGIDVFAETTEKVSILKIAASVMTDSEEFNFYVPLVHKIKNAFKSIDAFKTYVLENSDNEEFNNFIFRRFLSQKKPLATKKSLKPQSKIPDVLPEKKEMSKPKAAQKKDRLSVKEIEKKAREDFLDLQRDTFIKTVNTKKFNRLFLNAFEFLVSIEGLEQAPPRVLDPENFFYTVHSLLGNDRNIVDLLEFGCIKLEEWTKLKIGLTKNELRTVLAILLAANLSQMSENLNALDELCEYFETPEEERAIIIPKKEPRIKREPLIKQEPLIKEEELSKCQDMRFDSIEAKSFEEFIRDPKTVKCYAGQMLYLVGNTKKQSRGFTGYQGIKDLSNKLQKFFSNDKSLLDNLREGDIDILQAEKNCKRSIKVIKRAVAVLRISPLYQKEHNKEWIDNKTAQIRQESAHARIGSFAESEARKKITKMRLKAEMEAVQKVHAEIEASKKQKYYATPGLPTLFQMTEPPSTQPIQAIPVTPYGFESMAAIVKR